MDAVFELNGLASPAWFEQLTQNLPATGGVTPADLFEIRPPVGMMGAARKPKFKVNLQTVSQVAGVVSACVTLYAHAGLGGSTGQCNVGVSDGSNHVQLVVPCDAAHSPQLVATFEGVLAKLQQPPTSITIDPAIVPLEQAASGAGQP